jgi:hypothetical protein
MGKDRALRSMETTSGSLDIRKYNNNHSVGFSFRSYPFTPGPNPSSGMEYHRIFRNYAGISKCDTYVGSKPVELPDSFDSTKQAYGETIIKGESGSHSRHT